MDLYLDERMMKIGVSAVVVAYLENIDVNAKLNEEQLKTIEDRETWANMVDIEELNKNEIIDSYRDKFRILGKSLKKNIPTAIALVKNIQSRGKMPRINSIVDIYNAETLKTLMSVGAHDAKSISGCLKFTFADAEKKFFPIGGGEKLVHADDFLYEDDKGVLALLDCRDSENYKIKDDSKDILLIIQGNKETSVEIREESLERICKEICSIGGGNYKIKTVRSGETIAI